MPGGIEMGQGLHTKLKQVFPPAHRSCCALELAAMQAHNYVERPIAQSLEERQKYAIMGRLPYFILCLALFWIAQQAEVRCQYGGHCFSKLATRRSIPVPCMPSM